MCLIKPREEQRNVAAQAFATLQTHKSVLIVAPTGYGKTVLMADIAQQEIMNGGQVLTVVNLQVLLAQTVITMQHGFGIPCATLHDKITHYDYADDRLPLSADFSRKLHITMPRTFTNTMDDSITNNLTYDSTIEPTLLLLDEAHKATSAEFQKLRDFYPNVKVIGFTATPYREKNDSGESLEEWYGDRIIIASTISEQIALGNLATPVYKTYNIADAHIAKTWHDVTRDSENKRTIIFTDDTDHSKLLEKQFQDWGVPVEVVTAGKGVIGDDDYVARQPPAERDAIFTRFKKGITEVLISVNALCEGFDEAAAKFCFLTRKVVNIAFYQQMVGRVLRKFLGKPEGIICDFAGNVYGPDGHGPVEAIEWPRAAKGLIVKAGEAISRKTYARKANVHTECDGCGHIYNVKHTRSCKVCGIENGVKLSTLIAERIAADLGINEKVFADQVVTRLPLVMSGVLPAASFNKVTKLEIFIDGKLKAELGYLPHVVELYKKAPKGKKNAVWNSEMLEAA